MSREIDARLDVRPRFYERPHHIRSRGDRHLDPRRLVEPYRVGVRPRGVFIGYPWYRGGILVGIQGQRVRALREGRSDAASQKLTAAVALDNSGKPEGSSNDQGGAYFTPRSECLVPRG